jgi:hypothetical protein
MDEKRRVSRRRVLKGAIIEFNCGAHSCSVRNLSEAGAALDVPSAVTIPHESTLIMKTDGAGPNCRVIWPRDDRLGVVFEQVHSQPQL